MARQLDAAPGEVRVLFTRAEAADFLSGGAALPGVTPEDVLHRAARRVLQDLALEFATAVEGLEMRVEPLAAPLCVDVADAGLAETWYAVRFRLTAACADAAERRAVDDWVAVHAPALTFAVAPLDADGR